MPWAMSVSRMKTRQSLKSSGFGKIKSLSRRGSGEGADLRLAIYSKQRHRSSLPFF